jgi:hypothetical protein
MKLGLSREPWIDARRAQQVETDERLGKEPIPQMKWEVGMILICADITLGGVAAANSWGCQLVVNASVPQKVL